MTQATQSDDSDVIVGQDVQGYTVVGGVRLPATVCQTCGFIITNPPPPGRVDLVVDFKTPAEPGGKVEFGDVQVGPCPRCSTGVGTVSKGLMASLTEAARALQDRDSEELQRLRVLVAELQHEKKTSSEDAARRLEQADPALGPVASVLRSQPNRMELLAILAFLVALLQWLAPNGAESPTVRVEITETTVNNIVQDAAAPSWPRPGRNDPCPCASGRKYKKCHGAPPTLRPPEAGGGATSTP